MDRNPYDDMYVYCVQYLRTKEFSLYMYLQTLKFQHLFSETMQCFFFSQICLGNSPPPSKFLEVSSNLEPTVWEDECII
jgi:hypothetical protein